MEKTGSDGISPYMVRSTCVDFTDRSQAKTNMTYKGETRSEGALTEKGLVTVPVSLSNRFVMFGPVSALRKLPI